MLSLTPKARYFIQRILPFGLVSFISSVVYVFLEKGILGSTSVYPSTGNPYHFQIVIPALAASIFGLLIGTVEVLYLNKIFQKDRFIKKLLWKTVIYLALIVLFVEVVYTASAAYELGVGPFNRQLWEYNLNFIQSSAVWSLLLYVMIGVIAGLFITEVANNIGQLVLLNLFSGKYHHPQEEERVFMFLDMRSSTSIAEKLGHVRYFELLKTYYADLSDSILNYGGEIYQYVGDEVVISWKLKPHRTNDACIQCFFSMKEALQKQVNKYQQNFGVMPTFKAGIHFGRVTTGEIGVIKKDVVFTGDILNTTARIQGACNAKGVDLLVSETLLDHMDLSANFQVEAVGDEMLRGKEEQVSLYTIFERS